ncbi:MAG: histidinol dehydrogenase [Ferruginibacter sp.]
MDNKFINPGKEQWASLIKRPAFNYASLETIVQPILQDVKINGDAAVKKYAAKFDGVQLTELKVTAGEIENSVKAVDEELKKAIEVAIKNITTFHAAQIESVLKIQTTPGVVCWRKSIAIERVGLYIPGGTAPLFSTLLMLAIPAKMAGCKNIIVCTPCDKAGNVHPAVLYAAHVLGIQNIYKIGGAQAVAAMAYGTATVPSVNKIFGPGNQYVTCAKQLINREGIAIDMPAGPSELAVYADDTAVPAFVAADLLSQAEHGVDSQVVLLASSEKMIEAVQQQVEIQLVDLSRKDIAVKALNHSRWILMDTVDDAFEFLNAYAAEHLIIASEQAEELAEKVINAGSVFLGNYSPESAGDYASGTNHTLPTNGYATAYSGVSVDSFVKKITFQQLSQQGIKNIGKAVEIMAMAEGLDGHKNAVTIRLIQSPPIP